jgi:AcrR family transcriptional regulator
MARQQKRAAGRTKAAGTGARRATSVGGAGARPQRSLEDRAVDAALELAADGGWRGVSLAAIAEQAGLSLAELYAVLPSKGAVLDAFARRIDRATLSGVELDAKDAGTIRDRLFDIIMRNFDALEPHRAAVAVLVGDLPRSPLAALCQGARMLRSVAWMAAAAGVDTSGPLGIVRVKAIAAAYLLVLRAWLADESTDKSRTMAALDRVLKNLEMVAQTAAFRRPRPADPA